MANIKFSAFNTETNSANVDFLVGYQGTTMKKIAPSNLGGYPYLIDTDSLYSGFVPSGLSGNPQFNTVLGIDAGSSLTTGERNTLIGYGAGSGTATQNGLTAIGRESSLSGNNNESTVSIGSRSNRSGNSNNSVIIGDSAAFNGASSDSVIIGQAAGNASGGFEVTLIGKFAGAFGGAAAKQVSIGGGQVGRSNTAQSHMDVGYAAGFSQTSGLENTNIGYEAGYSNTTNGSRTCVGYNAGKSSTGAWNTLVGAYAGRLITGSGNTAVGRNALLNNTSGGSNVALGHEAGNWTAAGGTNTFIGTAAGRQNSSGNSNTSVGYEALRANLGSNNTSLGYRAGDSVTTGSNLTIIGYDADASSATATNEITLGNASVTSFRIPGIQSGASNGDVLTFNSSAGKLELQAGGGGGASSLNGLSDCLVDTDSLYVGEVPAGLSGNPQDNTILGIRAGDSLTSGDSNTLIGNQAGDSITTGTNSTAIGQNALSSLLTGGNNVAIGQRAYSSGTASNNVYIGNDAGSFANSGIYQVGIGVSAGNSNTGSNSIAIGWFSNRNNTATGTISIGHRAGYSQTSANENTNLGFEAGYSTTTNGSRTMIGYQAGKYNTLDNNVFVGSGAGRGNTGGYLGQQNIAIGSRALTNATGGNYNVVIGHAAGDGMTNGEWNTVIGRTAASSLTTGDKNIVIGMNSNVNGSNAENQIVIGTSATAGADNSITLGNANNNLLRIPGLGSTDGHVLTYEASSGGIVLKAAGGGGIDGSGTASYIPKWSDSDTLTDSGIYDSGTNIGIGTATPSARLQVIGTSTPAKFYYNSSFTNAQYTAVNIGMMTSGTIADGFGPKLTFRTGGNGFDGYAAADIGTKRNGADNTHDLTFATSTGGSMTDKMIIKNNGYVGIGTTSPSAKLSIEGTTGTTSSNLLTIKSNTSFPFGPIHIVDFINSSGSTVGRILMNTSSVTYSTSSDYRLKENIDEISNSINRVKQLKPKRFNFIGEADRTVDGFLAHEVAEVVPHAVDGEKDAIDSTGKPIYQGIDQSAIVPLLTAALQEAIAKIEDLETRIQELENK